MLIVIEGVSLKAFSDSIGKKNIDVITGIGFTETGDVDILLDGTKLSWRFDRDSNGNVKFHARGEKSSDWEVRFSLKSSEFVKITIY